ncbi:phage holin family protein [Dermatobacter hominis]|uniref:phage holin family protein n=1 Tax=Dermatobacter hominis TaxID=2884263 RepID=UPI001D122C37|nr:phage holin family protein [Dermatobacter hominis]UDY34355.1 phage holin family protein [Dermatobacter hominis]
MSEPTAPSAPSTAPEPGSAPGGRPANAAAPRPATSNGDWTDQVTDLIVDSVDKVRSHTTGPILEISKGMVYAVVALILALPIVVLFLVGLVRVFTIFLPAWATYLIFGIIFVLVGVVLWSKRGRVPT